MAVGMRVVIWSKFSPCVAIQAWLFQFEGLWDGRWRLYAVHTRCVSRFCRTDNIWVQLGCKSCRNFVSANRQSPSELYSGFSAWIYFHRLNMATNQRRFKNQGFSLPWLLETGHEAPVVSLRSFSGLSWTKLPEAISDACNRSILLFVPFATPGYDNVLVIL